MPNAPRCGPAMDSCSCQVTQGVTVMEWLPGEVCAQPPPGPVQGHITVSSRPAPRVTWLLLAEQGGVGLWTHRALCWQLAGAWVCRARGRRLGCLAQRPPCDTLSVSLKANMESILF